MPERLRVRLRRKAAFLVETGSESRRVMTPSEVEYFLRSIEMNDPNAWGLTKLSELRLDDPVEVSYRGYSWDAQNDVGLEGKMTLLTYAAWRGRAWIVRGLLRAGAVPELGKLGTNNHVLDAASPRDEYDFSNTGSTAVLSKKLHARYPEVATWVVIALTRMRAWGGKRLVENRENGHSTNCVFPECRAPRVKTALAFATCPHVACELCVWASVARKHGTLQCPECDPGETNYSGDTHSFGDTSDGMDISLFDACVAKETKRKSRERWLNMPADVKDIATSEESKDQESTYIEADHLYTEASCTPNPRRNNKANRHGKAKRGDPVLGLIDTFGARTSFAPLPVTAAARTRAEKQSTQDERCRDLLHAAYIGDTPSVVAIINEGVDVECRDECGFPPLALAAWRGRRGAVLALLHAGADPLSVAAGGLTALRAASANGHVEVRNMIEHVLGVTQGLNRDKTRNGDGGRLPTKSRNENHTKTQNTPCVSVTLLAVPLSAMEDVASGVGAVYGDGLFQEQEQGMSESTRKQSDSQSSFLTKIYSLADVVAGAFGLPGTCSDAERLHFLDAEGWVRSAISRAVERIVDTLVLTNDGVTRLLMEGEEEGGGEEEGEGQGGEEAEKLSDSRPTKPRMRCVVLPRMRFLRYPTPGGRLNPHVDLRKVDDEAESANRSTHTFCLYLATCDVGGETVTLDKVREPKDPMSDRFAFGVCAPKRGRLLIFPHFTPHAGRPVVDVPKVLLRGECYLVPQGG